MSGQVTGFSYAIVATPPTSVADPVAKTWSIIASGHGATDIIVPRPGEQGVCDGCIVGITQFIGETQTAVPSAIPTASIQSSQSGKVFSTRTLAPHTNIDSDPAGPAGHPKYTSAISTLTEKFTYRANQDSPTLSFLITVAQLEIRDYGGAQASADFCTWLPTNYSAEDFARQCIFEMSKARAHFDLRATNHTTGQAFFDIGSTAALYGQHKTAAAANWSGVTSHTNTHALWHAGTDFRTDFDADGDGNYRHATSTLLAPKRVIVPLQDIRKDDEFTVIITIWTASDNLIQGESSVEASLQDPLSASGLEITSSGLTQIPVRSDAATTLPPLGCTTGVDPAAGVLAFSTGTTTSLESNRSAGVLVSRVGGTTGEVGVRLRTRDGTALAGSDYAGTDQEVRFADGEGGDRLVDVPLVDDATIEPGETVDLLLSDVGGCAQLGTQASATLTILDDDTPRRLPGIHTVGGSVSGLAGSGLVIQDAATGASLAPGNGAFTFPDTRLDGSAYDVRVMTQPVNPIQQCTVTHGLGSIAGANVTDVAVTCTTPAPSGSLDASFGSGGRVASAVAYVPRLFDPRIGMALQADGKILMVGGLKLLRFNADGTPDGAFGSAGAVDVVFNGGALDTAMDVAVQADGRIVVIGTTATNTVGSDDFALVRYDANGSIDTGFGVGGHVTTDFNASTDRARRLRIQPDGRIIVIGSATQVISASVASVTFATARYNADGTLDTGFGVAGKMTDSPFGSYSIARGATIQADGKIVVAGSTANDGATDPDSGFVRYLADKAANSQRDAGFGFAQDGIVHAPVGQYDEVVDVVVLDDGTVLGAIRVDAGTTAGGRTFGFGLAHVPANGVPPPTAVTPLTVITAESDVPTSMLRQADGKIVVVGQSAALGANPDMAIVRYGASGLAVDASFGTNGSLLLDFFGARDSAEAVVQQADGKLVVGGYVRSGTSNVFALARLAP